MAIYPVGFYGQALVRQAGNAFFTFKGSKRNVPTKNVLL
jgi:hypothetical protein